MSLPDPDELPPCFFDASGDTVVSVLHLPSMWDLGTVEMRMSSDKLMAVSPYFAATLKSEWLYNKVTGNEDCGDGTSRSMKRYELELDKDGNDILVGKTAVTDLRLRISSAATTLNTLREPSDRFARGHPEKHLNTTSNVNLLGFSILCDFPSQTNCLLLDRIQRRQILPFSDIVQRLLRWIDYYGTFAGMRDRLARFIISEAPGSEIEKSMLFYLRVACVLRESSFFSWVLDKNPFFTNDVFLSMSSLDNRLGLDLWTSALERRLNLYGSVFRELRNLPERVPPFVREKAAADEWMLVLFAWNSWLLDRAADSQAKYEHINPSILALHSIAVSQDVMPYYSHRNSDSVLDVGYYLHEALIMAKETIARHITVDGSEPFGFQINDYDSFPQDYRVDEDTDEKLLDLIATSDLFAMEEDLVSGSFQELPREDGSCIT